jgi:hypothetical protein
MYESTKKFAQKYQSRNDALGAIERAIKKYSSPSGMYEIIEEKQRTKSKYNATRCWVNNTSYQIFDSEQPDSIAFDSIFEAKVYQELILGRGSYTVARQYPLLIKPETSLYKRLEWCVDFYVYDSSGSRLKYAFVEAKGISQPEFIRNLQYFQFFNQKDYEKLIIVTEEKRKIDKNIQSIGLKEFRDLIKFGLLLK